MKTISNLLLLFLILLAQSNCQLDILASNQKETTIPDKEEYSTHEETTDKIKVLFIGNSLTFFNQMPQVFKNLAVKAGKSIIVGEATKAGTPLRQLVNNSTIISKINSDDWDYIILQSDDITAFPDMYNIEINTLKKFKQIIHTNNEPTQIIYQMVWGLRNGVTVQELNGENVFYSYYDYLQKIYDGTIFIAKEMDLKISPVGWTWRKIRTEYPEIELFSSDNAHPSYKGSFLTAAVHYSVIFGESSDNINFIGELTSDEAQIFKQAASTIVLDNSELWHLDNSLSIDD